MKGWKRVVVFFFLFLGIASLSQAEDYSLQYFMTKFLPKGGELSKKEKAELLNRMEQAMDKAQEVQGKLSQAIQTGDMEANYQEGKFWMSKLEEDRGSIDTGTQDLKALKEKPAYLTGAIRLYKTLRDLSIHLNSYNNMPSFSAWVGDLAPEMELWTDVFYKLYLLPLARLKDTETQYGPMEKKPVPKGRKP
jgi:hypothetical protein